jgi:hypothetical protein
MRELGTSLVNFRVEVRNMKRFALIGLLAVSLAVSVPGLTAETSVAAAQAAAQTWLGLVDAGNYSQSWSTAAKHLQESIPESKWDSHISEIRSRLGPVQSRSLAAEQAESGERVVVRFATHFEHKADATEVVTSIKDSDGQWRVEAYSIK